MKTLYLILTALAILLFGKVYAQTDNSYYFNKEVEYSFEKTTEKVKAVLKDQGFGIISEIDMQKTLKEKLDNVDLQPYKILGACNPKFAYETIQTEENIGLFLPCKVLIKKIDDNRTEVVMINPSELMQMLGNKDLIEVADQVTEKFKKALDNL